MEKMELDRLMAENVPISPAIQGAGYLMSAYIVFVHAGGENGKGGFGNLLKARQIYFHILLFIILGGLSMAISAHGHPISHIRSW